MKVANDWQFNSSVRTSLPSVVIMLGDFYNACMRAGGRLGDNNHVFFKSSGCEVMIVPVESDGPVEYSETEFGI